MQLKWTPVTTLRLHEANGRYNTNVVYMKHERLNEHITL